MCHWLIVGSAFLQSYSRWMDMPSHHIIKMTQMTSYHLTSLSRCYRYLSYLSLLSTLASSLVDMTSSCWQGISLLDQEQRFSLRHLQAWKLASRSVEFWPAMPVLSCSIPVTGMSIKIKILIFFYSASPLYNNTMGWANSSKMFLGYHC